MTCLDQILSHAQKVDMWRWRYLSQGEIRVSRHFCDIQSFQWRILKVSKDCVWYYTILLRYACFIYMYRLFNDASTSSAVAFLRSRMAYALKNKSYRFDVHHFLADISKKYLKYCQQHSPIFRPFFFPISANVSEPFDLQIRGGASYFTWGHRCALCTKPETRIKRYPIALTTRFHFRFRHEALGLSNRRTVTM